jgi:hypothetical protein
LAPKHLNCGLKTIEIAVFIAASVFNESYNSILQMSSLDIVIGQQCKIYADQYDAHRIQRQDRRSTSSTKEARSARQEEKAALQGFYEETEGLLWVWHSRLVVST